MNFVIEIELNIDTSTTTLTIDWVFISRIDIHEPQVMVKQDTHLMEITGLELAKYILLRLVNNRESIEQ